MKVEFEATCSRCGSADLILVDGETFCRACDLFVHVSLQSQKPQVNVIKYRHFKGAIYEVVGEAYHSETEEKLVLYRREGTEKVWVRPYEMFHGMHESGVRRFEPIQESSRERT